MNPSKNYILKHHALKHQSHTHKMPCNQYTRVGGGEQRVSTTSTWLVLVRVLVMSDTCTPHWKWFSFLVRGVTAVCLWDKSTMLLSGGGGLQSSKFPPPTRICRCMHNRSCDTHVIKLPTTLMKQLLDCRLLRVEHQRCHVIVVGIGFIVVEFRTKIVSSLIPETEVTLERG